MPSRLTALSPLALASAGALALGCCTSTSGPVAPPPVSAPAPRVAPAPTYDVHEWGLIRGTASDLTMLSGPHAHEVALPLGKPVLYFHRIGEGPLEVDVDVHIEGGRVVEHWPEANGAGEPGSDIHWHVQLGEQSCPGLRYPDEYTESPCSRLLQARDACEAAQLRIVETSDATCLLWPLADAPEARWNHLFYRAELHRDPHLPLTLQVDAEGVLHATPRGAEPMRGSILRLRRGAVGVPDAAVVVRAPSHGETVDIPSPSGPMAPAMEALDAALREAGLTVEETAAFRRAWDATLFGSPSAGDARLDTVLTATPMAGGLIGPASSRSVLYILPQTIADSLATLRLTPAPRTVRRVIVAWVDEPGGLGVGR